MPLMARVYVKAGIYFSQTSLIYFCRGFSCCPYYRGVRNSEVSERRELTVSFSHICLVLVFLLQDASEILNRLRVHFSDAKIVQVCMIG